jgi:hypothetical protein
MKKWLKLSLWVVFIVLVGIQFIPVQRNEIEPVTIADFIELYEPRRAWQLYPLPP